MIVLLSGLGGVGKDTFAEMLQEELEELKVTSSTYAFADPLKDIICKTLGISRKKLEYFKRKEDVRIGFRSSSESMCTERNVRHLLQQFGTEAMKPVFGDDVWVALTADKIKEDSTLVQIVTDFRVFEEYAYLKGNSDGSIYTVLIERSDVQGGTHATETSLTDFQFDLLVDNSYTLDDLRACAKELAKELTKVV